MLTKLRGRMDEHSENFNKRKYKKVPNSTCRDKNAITEQKNTQVGIYNRLEETEWIGDLEHIEAEITQTW